jgi:hypothetical protein
MTLLSLGSERKKIPGSRSVMFETICIVELFGLYYIHTYCIPVASDILDYCDSVIFGNFLGRVKVRGIDNTT